ncbi:MAG: hypothetical protein CMJ95_07740 [Planctomycetes bacterium]|nr:hypothetical protein [Planctomycetota bacterium]
MKQLSIFSLAILILMVAVGFNTTFGNGDGISEEMKQVVPKDEPASPDEAIEKAMEAMKSAGRSIRRALRKKDVEVALAVVNRAQLAVIEAKKLVPAAAKKLKGDARSALERDFRQRLIAVLERWILVEKALLLGKTEDATEFVRTIVELKKSAHEEFDVED